MTLFFSRAGALALASGLLTSVALAEDDAEVYLQLDSRSFSESMPIDQLIHDMEGKAPDHGTFAFTHNQIEIGEQRGNISISYFLRYDYYLQYSDDTAQLAYLYRNDLPIAAGRRFEVDLRPNHIRAQGLGFGFALPINAPFENKIRLNYLDVSKVTDGRLSGELTSTEDDYIADLQLDYGYSRDTILDRPEEDTKGYGLSLDFDLAWAPREDLTLRLIGRDALSLIRYDDLSYTEARATTNRVSFAPDGSIQSTPAISGIESFRNQRQQLPKRFELAAEYTPLADQQVGARLYSYDRHVFPVASYRYSLAKLTLNSDYDFRAKAWSVGISHRYAHFKIGSDSLDWERAKALNLSAGIRIPF